MQNELAKTFTFALLVVLTAALAAASALAANTNSDTYNFYFQKAPGPTTVNQGTAGASTETGEPIAPEVAPAPGESASTGTAQAAPAPLEKPRKPPHFHLGILFGRAINRASAGSMNGVGLGISYFFTPMIGIGLGGFFYGTEDGPTLEATDDSSQASRARSGKTEKSIADIYVGINFYPLRTRLGDNASVDFGIVAGGKSAEDTLHYGSGEEVKGHDENSQLDLFGGPSVAVNFARNLGALAEAHFSPGRAPTYVGGLKVMF